MIPMAFFTMKRSLYLLILILFGLSGCGDKNVPTEILTHDGPFQEAEDLILYYSEAVNVQVRLTTKKLWEYENGDREFPEGIFMEFFGEDGEITSTLRADEAYFDNARNKWRGRGDVEIRNICLVYSRQGVSKAEMTWKSFVCVGVSSKVSSNSREMVRPLPWRRSKIPSRS